MNKNKTKTVVVFKKFESGEIVALFPDEICNSTGLIGSYMRIGQHSGASPELIQDLDSANPREYAALKRELESIGYNLKIRKID